jgi:hypothetical protein
MIIHEYVFLLVCSTYNITYPDHAYEARPNQALSLEDVAFGTTSIFSPFVSHRCNKFHNEIQIYKSLVLNLIKETWNVKSPTTARGILEER